MSHWYGSFSPFSISWNDENTLICICYSKEHICCITDGCSLHVNSGGSDVPINEGNREVDYVGDAEVEGGSAKYYLSSSGNWGFSSTGDFMDDSNDQNTRFIETVSSSGLSELYRNARVSPLSLTYFSYCLENGDYNVSLHFAEIIFTDNNTYFSLGRRLFDIYIQVIIHLSQFYLLNDLSCLHNLFFPGEISLERLQHRRWGSWSSKSCCQTF